jgi:tRNA threonylcarbamoyladenosine biosynthesis protein TsaB
MGLRIGLGVAKGIALTRRLPLVAVPTLDITASAQPRARGRLVAVLQAGRGRICTQTYTWSRHQSPAGWRARGELWLGRWPALVERVDREMTFCGEIDPAGYEALAALGDLARIRPAASSLRRAGWLAEVAWRRLRAGETDDPFTVAPIYVS